MKRVFIPSRRTLHPRITRTPQRKLAWHIKNGYGTGLSVRDLWKHKIAIRAGSFLLLIEDGGTRHHGNAGIAVFNKNGVLVDDRVWFNPIKGRKVPRKAFIGTQIVDGSKPMKFRPLRKRDSQFKP